MATNQNIYGYIPTEAPDWGKLTTGLSTTISGIGERREKEKEYLDQLKADNIKIVQQSDSFNSQNFGQMMLGASQNGVGQIKAWNDALKRGELDPKIYKQRMNNLMEGWGTLANSVKSFDAKNAEIQKQLQDGTASQLSVEAAEYFAQMGDLKNMQTFIDEEGNVSTGRLDPTTGRVIPDTIESSKSIASPSNSAFVKVDLDKQIQDISGTFGKVKTENGLVTTVDARNNPAFKSKLYDIKGSMTNNNRLTASILVDNTGDGYTTYYTSKERDTKLNSAINKENSIRNELGLAALSGNDLKEYIKEAESKLIPMQKDASGIYQPMISSEQLERAQKAIEDTLFIQLGFERTEDEITKNLAGTGSNSEDLKFYNLAASVNKSWGSSEALSAISKDYDFKWNGNNLDVYQLKSDGRGGMTPTKVGSIKTKDQLGPYLGISTAQLGNWTKSLGAAPSAPAKPKPKPATKPATKNNDPLGIL